MRRTFFLFWASTLFVGVFGVVLLFSGCGSGGGNSIIVEGGERSLSGRILAAASYSASIRANSLAVASSSSDTVPLGGVEVWLEDLPSLKVVTDSGGRFIFPNVPEGSHRVVGRFPERSGNPVLKARTGSVTAPAAGESTWIGDLVLQPARNFVRGIIRDLDGKPVPNVPLYLWGEIFLTDGDGKFAAPPLPDSETSGEIRVPTVQGYAGSSFLVPFFSDLPPLVEATLVSVGETRNRPPFAALLASRNKVQTSETIDIEARISDPEETDPGKLKVFWEATHGLLASGESEFHARWTSPGSDVTATLTIKVVDPAGASCSAVLPLRVGSGGVGDSIPPQIAAFSPASGAVDISTGSVVTVTFTEKMDAVSVGQAFSLENASGAKIPFDSQSWAQGKSEVYRFTPRSPLASFSAYFASVKGGAAGARDLALNTLSSGLRWKFTTGGTRDTVPPAVLAMLPAPGTIDVPVATQISIRFSEPVSAPNVGSGSFRVSSGSSVLLGTISFGAGWDTAIFTPLNPFPHGSVISVRIGTECCDLAGNHLTSPFTGWFRTILPVDTTPPWVISTYPVGGRVGVATSTRIGAVFSEPLASASNLPGAFSAASGAFPIAGTVLFNLDFSAATFTPLFPLPYGSSITTRISSDCKDLAGNSLSPITWTFSTVASPYQNHPPQAPVVASPTANQKGVALSPRLVVHAFSDQDPGEFLTRSEWQVFFRSDLASSALYWKGVESGSAGTEIKVDGVNGSFTWSTTTELAYQMDFWLVVRFFDSQGVAGSWSAPVKFTTLDAPNNPPSAPYIFTPSAEAAGVATNPVFAAGSFSDWDGDGHGYTDWEIHDNATPTSQTLVWKRYGEIASLTTILVDSANGSFSNALVGKSCLSYSTEYWARVRYADNHGAISEWSNPRRFTTRPEHVIEWLTDFDVAKALSRSSGKRILLYIYASWCGVCRRLEDQTFIDESVISDVNSRFIPLKLDEADPLNDSVEIDMDVGGFPSINILSTDSFHEVLGWDGFYASSAFLAIIGREIPDLVQPTVLWPLENWTGVPLNASFGASPFVPVGTETFSTFVWQIADNRDVASAAWKSRAELNVSQWSERPNQLKPGTDFWVRVRNETSQFFISPWSDFRHFQTTATPNRPPLKPVVLAPANQAMNVDLNPSCTGTAFLDPDVGDFLASDAWEVRDSPVVDLKTLVWSGSNITGLYTDVFTSEGTFEGALAGKIKLEPVTPYWIRVRYFDSGGLASDWSDFALFTTGF